MAKQRTSGGYELRVKNDEDHFSFDLLVTGDDSKQYTLSVSSVNDQPGLVIHALQTLGIVWPAFAFKFAADNARRITDISQK